MSTTPEQDLDLDAICEQVVDTIANEHPQVDRYGTTGRVVRVAAPLIAAALTADRDAARARVEKLEAEIAWRVEMSRKAMVGQDKLSDGLVNHIDELRAENKRAAAIIADYIDDVARLQAKVAELEAAAGLPGSCICDDDGPDEPLCAPCYVETLARQANVQGRRADAAEADNARLRAELAEARGALGATERTLDRMVSEAATDSIRLCVDTHTPIDPGNYPGPIHCLAHPQGHACVTAMYARVPDSTYTADERTALAPSGAGDEEGRG